MTKITLDWAIQLRSVGNGTTHVVMQAGRYGGLTTYEVGFGQWMQVCQALHSCLAAWTAPAQYFPVPSHYGELIDAGSTQPPPAQPASPISVTVDYIATVQQALAAHVGKKVWVGVDTIPAKKLDKLRAVLSPQLASDPIPTGTNVAPVLALVDAIARANAGIHEVATQVSAFVGSAPGQPSHDEARALAERAQAAMQTGAVDDKIDAAARLLLGGQHQAAIDAYLAIAHAHPEYTGTCYSQVGAALFFMAHYGRAIEYYEAAKQHGADPAMMDENIHEARGCL